LALKLNKHMNCIIRKKHKDAVPLLKNTQTTNTYDNAFTNKFIGNLYATMEGKSSQALKYLTKAYQTNELNHKEQADVIKLLAQIYMMQQQYSDGIAKFEEWISYTGIEEANIYNRIANAYYELKQLDKVITPANKAISLSTEPFESPYILKLASYHERKMYKQSMEVGETLVELFPKEKRYWLQLQLFYTILDDYKKAL